MMTRRLMGPVPYSLELRQETLKSKRWEDRTPFRSSERNAILPYLLAKYTS